MLALPAWHSAVGWDARLSKTRRTAPHHCPYFCWGGVWCKWDLALRAQPQNLRLFANKQEKKKTTISLTWHELRSQTHVEPNSFVLLCTPLPTELNDLRQSVMLKPMGKQGCLLRIVCMPQHSSFCINGGILSLSHA